MPNTAHTTIDMEEVADERYCSQFTTDHGLDTTLDEAFYFAFVCPGCAHHNSLKGDPHEFRDKPFRCLRCTRVSFLVGPALDRFAEEVGVDA